MELKIDKLSNQLNTLFIHTPESSAGSVQIWFRAGSVFEPKDSFGIAHFLEHMFFKGTPRYPGPLLTKEIESYGGEVNAFTSFDYTCYYINTPNQYLHKSTEILLDMVTNPEFKPDELLPERDVVFEEFRRSLDSPNQFAFKQIQTSCFLGGYAHPILGTEQTIKSFTKKQLVDFRELHYNLSNAMLIVAGNINNSKKLINLIEKFKLPSGPASNFPNFKLKKNSTVQIHKKEVRMNQLNIVIQSPGYLDRNASSEDLAINCLGHGETSRLYKNLVLKNTIANNCSASTMYFSNGGAHFLKVTFPPQNSRKVYKAIFDTFKEIFDKGFSENEVSKIKNQYIASKIYEKESIESFAFSLGHGFAQNGDIHCEEEFIGNIKKTRLSSVNDSFENILERSIHFNLQIPQNESLSHHRQELKTLQNNLNKLKRPSSSTKKLSKKVISSKFDPNLKLININDGVKLIYRKNTMTPTFVLHSYIRGGIAHETKDNNGLHYILSNSITKGHDNIPYDTIKNSLEEKSSNISGFAGKNSFGITMHGQTEHVDELFQHFFGTLLKPTFLSKYVNQEKTIIKRVLENQKEDPAKQCFKAVNELFFKNHPYSLDLLGSATSLKNLNPDLIKNYHKKTLQGNEVLFTYCGDLDLQNVLTLLEPFLASLKKRMSRKDQRPLPIQGAYYGSKIHIPFDREQTHIFIGIPALSIKDKRDIHLKILTTFLSGQSSELFVEVRDRMGLCYVVQPVHFSALDGGHWGIYMASGHDKTQKAIDSITKILNKIRHKGLTKSEFATVKKMVEGQSSLSLQTNDDFASIYSIPELYGLGMDHFHKCNQEIKKLSHDQFNSFIKKFLNVEYNIITVGRNG